MTQANPFALDAPPTQPAQAPVTAQPDPATDPAYQAFLAQQQAAQAAQLQAAAQQAMSAQSTQPAAGGPIGDDPFGAPAPQLARGPRLREMHGRLILILPYKVETVPNKKADTPGATQERMTADVVVLDGGTIHYGGRPEALPSVPHTKVAEPPLKSERMFISSVGLVSQCRDALANRLANRPGPRMVLGRLAVGEAKPDQSPPYLLTPATDAEKQIARAYLATVDPFS